MLFTRTAEFFKWHQSNQGPDETYLDAEGGRDTDLETEWEDLEGYLECS